ncbi:MAG: HAD family hydrolase [Dehalococcoidia bacterium]|nr:HAD family hydrolase [Dehalococcoidia bacterium]
MISFDIDGTLEVGDPPGAITLATVWEAHELGIVIGSCSDRPVRIQREMWETHGVPMMFTVLKQHLDHVRESFSADHYLHVGDTEVDRAMAEQAGFEFLDALVDAEARLLDGLRGD